MHATAVFLDLPFDGTEQAREFYTDYLGMSEETLSLGWVTRLGTPDGRARLQLLTRDATAPVDPIASIGVDDIDTAYQQAIERGYEIVHPLTDEPWGIRRFLVRTPDGNVLNINTHRD